MKELFPVEAPPPGFGLVDELVSRLRDGRLDSTPRPSSGWYEHQFHALVALLMPERMPEAERLVVGPKYCEELERQFRALFGLTRETHIKQLERLCAAGIPLVVAPRLTIEPLAELYRRRAESYLFLRQALVDVLGEPPLANSRRLFPTGSSDVPLLEELAWMEQLFRGAHTIVRQELGFEDAPETMLPSVLHARRWLREWTSDPDLSQDARTVVPLFYDLEREQTKVSVVLGFHSTNVSARFLREPHVRLHGENTEEARSALTFMDRKFQTASPVTAELYVSHVPNRFEFRAVCDEYVRSEAILEALQGLPSRTEPRQ